MPVIAKLILMIQYLYRLYHHIMAAAIHAPIQKITQAWPLLCNNINNKYRHYKRKSGQLLHAAASSINGFIVKSRGRITEFIRNNIKIITIIIMVISVAIAFIVGLLWLFDWGIDCANCKGAIQQSDYQRNQALILFGVVTSIVTPIFVIWGRVLTSQHNNLTLLRNNTDQYVAGVNLLNETTNIQQMAGLYSLRDLAKQSPEQEFIRVIDVLCAWVRQERPLPDSPDDAASANDAASLNDEVIKSPAPSPQYADAIQLALNIITSTYPNEWSNAQQNIANKARKQQYWPNLSYCNLNEATLFMAHLEEANLNDAHLEGAQLWGAHLEWAYLWRADLAGAELFGAHLEGAQLWRAHLEEANLNDAHLEGANLAGADLSGANLRSAKLEGAKNLTIEQVLSAIWDKTPPSLPADMMEDADIQQWLKDAYFNKEKKHNDDEDDDEG